jgi:hypothetical protein
MTTDGVRLGDLLTGAGLLQASDLREAMLISKQQGLPVGRVLIMSGYLTEQHLQAAVQAQSLLKDGLIEFALVIKALTMVGAEDITLEDAFKRLKWNQQSDAVTNKLGELLLAADIVPIDSLNAALLQCQSIGLPLGRVLIANGVLTEQMLAATLNAQVFVRDKKLSREQAIQGLKSSKERQIPIEQYLAETGAMQLPTTETVRLGELFVLAGIIDEPNLMGAVEVGLLNEQPIGQVLLQSSLISEEILIAALDLQAMVGAGAIKKDEAAKFLGTVKNKKVSVGEAIAIGQRKPSVRKQATVIEEPPLPAIEPLPLYQFLQLSGMITAKQIEQAIRVGSKDTQIMGKMLSLSGVMEQFLIDAAQKCNDLITAGVLNHEQGMIVLKSCERNQFTLEQAFAELGWNTAPLRANPDIPEALLDAPEPKAKDVQDETDTTMQLANPKFQEVSEEANAVPAWATPDNVSTNSSPSAFDTTVHSANPFGPIPTIPSATEQAGAVGQNQWPSQEPAPAAGQVGAAGQSQWPAEEAAPAADLAGAIGQNQWPAQEAAPAAGQAEQFGSNPFLPPASDPFPPASDPFAGGMSSSQLAEQALPSPFVASMQDAEPSAQHSENPFGQISGGFQAAQPITEPADPFVNSDAWQAASPDEWMPPATPTTVPEQPAEPAPAAAEDPWQAGGQAQQNDTWQGFQPQQERSQAAATQPPQQEAQPAQPAAAEWQGGPTPQPQESWRPESQQSELANALPTPEADWTAPVQPQQSGWQAAQTPPAQADWTAAQPAAEAAPAPAPAPADWQAPGAPAPASQPSWQAAAPSPLPGWQSSSTANQDAWQPMPSSPAAQMFQEAAQSLQGPPAANDTSAQPPAATDQPQSPMDIFAGDDEEPHPDQQDKPKKRLSDLMPKFGQKN